MSAAPGPWISAEPLDKEAFDELRRRAIFDCCKWDPQVEDVCTVADVPIVLTAAAWRDLRELSTLLATEALAAEDELVRRPELHGRLGLPRRVTRVLSRSARRPTPGVARIVRFDFHHTDAGWRISEANSDVPGGLNEASGLAALMLPHYPGAAMAGDAAGAYARALAGACGSGGRVAFVHATAYTDDRQVMTYLARRLEEVGARASLVSPAQLRWRDGRAHVHTEWATATADSIVRFFPAEWLPNLPGVCGWTHFFHGGTTPVSNPASAVLSQSKRFPLVWDALQTRMPTWRVMLPETRDPRDAPWHNGDWVVKPALGRVGEGVGVPGVVSHTEWERIARDVKRAPALWIAQRRFAPTSLSVRNDALHPSVGVYTIDGHAVGAYGRLAQRPLIDSKARDAAVLVAADEPRAAQEAGVMTEGAVLASI